MSPDSIGFLLGETGRNLRRDRLISGGTLLMVAVASAVLGASVLLGWNLRLLTERFSQELVVRVYLDKERVSRREARTLRTRIAGWPDVATANLVTREEGWKSFKKKLGGRAAFDTLQNPLPDSIEVRAREAEKMPLLAKKLEGLPGASKVIPGAEESRKPSGFTAKVLRFRQIAHLALILLGLLIALAALLIIHNSIRLTLFSRRREIHIMQLVGAANTFVAAPFLLEGGLLGLLGSAAACAALLPAYLYVRHLLTNASPFQLLLPVESLGPFASGLLAFGLLTGLFGAALSLRRFLRYHPDWPE